jgi:hypothetical protein
MRTLIVSFLFVTCGFSQGVSLGERARQERARQRTTASVVITNTDVMSSRFSGSQTEVLRFTGADQILETVSMGFIQAVKPEGTHFSEPVQEQLRTAALESLSPAKLMPMLERRFEAELDPATLQDVRTWYSSPVGVRITAAAGPVANGDNVPVSEFRAQLLAQLENATQQSERLTSTFVLMMQTMSARILAGDAEFERSREAFLSGLDAGFRQGAASQIRQLTMAQYSSQYRAVNDEDLMAYIQFLKSATGQNLVRALWASTQAVLVSGAGDCGNRMADILRNAS